MTSLLIYIDNTVEVKGQNPGLTDDELMLFSDLASAYRRGQCLLCGDIRSLEWLMKNISGLASGIFRQIRNNYSQTRAIVDVLETSIVLSFSAKPTLPTWFSGKYRVLNICDAINLNISTKCAMIAENLTDCSFYELMGKRFAFEKEVMGIDISFHHELGGGGTINSVFQKCVETDKVLSLCIVDSDIKYGRTPQYPNEPARGGTVKKLEETYENIKKKIPPDTYTLYCIPVHEVENLIPFDVLKYIAETSVPSMGCGVQCMQKMIDARKFEALLYYDLKNGVVQKEDGPFSAYWREIATSIGDDSLPGLCSKILEKALVILKNEEDKNGIVNVNIDEHLLGYWESIGGKVFSWGCANKPSRS